MLGLGSDLQVIASLSITEMFVLCMAPFLFFDDYYKMRRDGVMNFFILSLMVIAGCIVASIVNNTPRVFVLRGMAVTCLVSCSIVVAHWILRRDPNGFKWFILAIPVSSILSTFIFKSTVEVDLLGASAEEIMSGPIYWIKRITPLVMAPTKGWYLKLPTTYNALAPIGVAVFSVLYSISGRGSAVRSLFFAVMVLIGGKRQKTMGRISRHFGVYCCLAILIVLALYAVYKISASRGWLGDAAYRKYEQQTDGGHGGLGRLLLGGRGDSFIGLLACKDKPIIGWGPWCLDENQYTEEFIFRFGTVEDIATIRKNQRIQEQYGVSTKLLPCHAYITEFWAWYGVFGLVFWIYVGFVLLRFLKEDVAAVPQWYGWIACSIPAVFWGMFFNPFADRFGVPLFVVACLMARAVRKGAFVLPVEMRNEIERFGA